MKKLSSKRRVKYDIYANVIEVIAKKVICSLTRISYGANMPVDRTKKVLEFLASRGFVREVMVGDRKSMQLPSVEWSF